MTYTVARLIVSPETFDEIAAKLRKADYGHAFMSDTEIDMTHIAINREGGAEAEHEGE